MKADQALVNVKLFRYLSADQGFEVLTNRV